MAVILNIETSAAATSVALTAEGMVLAHQGGYGWPQSGGPTERFYKILS